MAKDYDYTPQEQAQAAIQLAAAVNAEYGWDEDCSAGVDVAKRLYERHGPFELTFGYGITEPDWYEPGA